VLKTRALLVNQRTQAIQRAAWPPVGVRHHCRRRHNKGCGTDLDRARQDGSASSEGCPSCLNGSRQPDRRVEGADRETRAGRSSRPSGVDDDARRLVTIPGVGAIIAASVRALVPDPGGFKSGRHFAGLARLEAETAFQRRQGSGWGAYRRWAIPRCGSLLVVGATRGSCGMRGAIQNASRWIATLLARRPYKVVCRRAGQQDGPPSSGPLLVKGGQIPGRMARGTRWRPLDRYVSIDQRGS